MVLTTGLNGYGVQIGPTCALTGPPDQNVGDPSRRWNAGTNVAESSPARVLNGPDLRMVLRRRPPHQPSPAAGRRSSGPTNRDPPPEPPPDEALAPRRRQCSASPTAMCRSVVVSVAPENPHHVGPKRRHVAVVKPLVNRGSGRRAVQDGSYTHKHQIHYYQLHFRTRKHQIHLPRWGRTQSTLHATRAPSLRRVPSTTRPKVPLPRVAPKS